MKESRTCEKNEAGGGGEFSLLFKSCAKKGRKLGVVVEDMTLACSSTSQISPKAEKVALAKA